MDENKVILRIDVQREMDTGKAFKMCYVTHDQKRGTGGVLKTVVNWCKVKKELDTDIAAPGQRIKKNDPILNSEYYHNGIVNIYNPNDYLQHITAVHWSLITFFNDKRVIN